VQYRRLVKQPFRTRKFTSKSAYKSLQILKLAIGAVTLFPLRIILLFFTVALAYVTAAIGDYLTPRNMAPEARTLAYCKFATHSWWILVTNRLTRLTLFCLGLTSIKLKGKVPVDYNQDTPWMNYSVVAAPHSGTFDWSLIVAKASRLLSPTIKAEAYKPAQHYIKLTAPIVIDRMSSESRRNAVKETNKRIIDGTSKGWFPVLCFPEGTNGNRKQLLRFKAGPFIPGQPLIPVIIRYPQDDDLNENDLITWAHFGRSVPFSILVCMCRLQTTIVYQFLDPYFPTKEEQQSASLYAENVRQYMAKEAKVETSDWTYDDIRLMKRCRKSRVQPEIGAIKVAKVFENVKKFETISMDLLEVYLSVLEANMSEREKEQQRASTSKLLPVLNREILVAKLMTCDIYPLGSDMAKIEEIFERRLPNYVSFEQLAIVFAEVLKM